MLKLAKQKKKEIAAGKAVASAAGPGGILTSFRSGLQTLTDILADRLGCDAVVTGRKVMKVVKGGEGLPYRVVTDAGDLEADVVVLATPAYATAEMVREMDTYMCHALLEI